MCELRAIAEFEERSHYSMDQYAVLMEADGDPAFLLLSWYKSRGRTEGAWVIEGADIHPLTLGEAERFIAGSGNEV
jgi:hypothetical protein